jgi:hypothetical protein
VFDFGIFNPVGPTVGSMEVAVNYHLQRALLITRIRHPFAPSVRVHALLDFDGFQKIAPLVQHVVATLDWSGPEWLRVRHPNPEVHEAVFDGLRVFARMRSDRDWGEKATQLVDAAHDPWQRLDSRFEAQSSVPEGIDPIDYWVAVVTNPRVIDGHVAMMRSAWEGAQAFVRNDDPEDAQRVSEFLRRQVYQRSDPDRSGVTPNE